MKRWSPFVSVLLLLVPMLAVASISSDEDIAKSLADLLVAGRAIMSQNQDLINDPAKGDKGFTGAVFEEKLNAEYRSKTGIDLRSLKPTDKKGRLLLALAAAEKDAVNDFQPVINKQGMGFKGFTPAVFGLLTGEKFLARTGIRIKQTSMKYRNAANRPDDFEAKTLAKFEQSQWAKGKGYSEAVEVGGNKTLRYMQPLYIADSCLRCHGDPKGSLDISGRAKEGYKVGELRGAVSILLPLN